MPLILLHIRPKLPASQCTCPIIQTLLLTTFAAAMRVKLISCLALITTENSQQCCLLPYLLCIHNRVVTTQFLLLLCLKPSNDSACQSQRPYNYSEGPMQFISLIFVIAPSLVIFLPTYSASDKFILILYASSVLSQRTFVWAVLSSWNTCFSDILIADFLHTCVSKSLIKCCFSKMVQPDWSLPFKLKPLPPVLQVVPTFSSSRSI